MSNGFKHARMIPCDVEDVLLQKFTDNESPGMILWGPREEHLQPRPHSGHVPRIHDSFQGKVTVFVQSCVFVLCQRHECRIGSSDDAEQAAFKELKTQKRIRADRPSWPRGGCAAASL